MIINYIKTALRNLAKHKWISGINVLGLSLGIGCFSLFVLYAVNELNFDNFHVNSKNVFRVFQKDEAIGENPASARPYHPMTLGPAMKQDLSGIEDYVRFLDSWGTNFVKTDNNVLRENLSYADPSFFSFFSFPLIHGDRATALRNLQSLVLTESEAKKLFGKTDIIGRTVLIKVDSDFQPFSITAVAADPPSNSTIQFTMLGNFEFWATTKQGKRGLHNWNQISYQTFVKVQPGTQLLLTKKIPAYFREKYFPGEEAEARKNGYTGATPSSWYGLQPLTEMHTDVFIDGSAVNTKTIWILLGISGCVLFIACINFTTLSISSSASRSKEVGLRKVIGGSRKSLIVQFLAESTVLAVISGLLGIMLAQMFLPLFNLLSGRNLQFSLVQFPQLLWLIIILVLIVGLLAGIYPALILSGFRPMEALKSTIKFGGSNFFTRGLVTLQFVVSAGLIICTGIIMQQLHFLKSKDPGFNKDNLIDIDVADIPNTKKIYTLFNHYMEADPDIVGVTSADAGLGEGTGSNQMSYKYNGSDKLVYEYYVDPNYLNVLGLDLLNGRNFRDDIGTDTVNSVIINEAMLNDLGWSAEEAIGKKIQGYYQNSTDDPRTPIVIGVVKNFNYLDLRQTIQPQMFDEFPYFNTRHFFVRIRHGDPSKAIAKLREAWNKVAPDYPLKYNFVDENLARFYKSETAWSRIVGWAGGISIVLACLGLLGLASLACINRIKEIGIRKVLGASGISIMKLLSINFLRLIAVALIITIPLTIWIMSKWLEDYAYRITMHWSIFALTAFGIICISILTLSVQVIKAGNAKPVENLRNE